MSMTRVDGQGREPETDVERRDSTAPRINYEALVEVGSRSVGGFEAEAVDVSLDGIRLRTAYLPSPGERLVCRFDGFGGEIVAEGQVAWCHDEGRGGEFGVRFTRLDARALELLKHMCHVEHAPDAEPSAPAAGEVDAAQPGARVRLHIQGLGSPMRARVRDVARGEVLIGSNLEFLRVGRDVELEDVDRGSTRVAHIEHVSVDIDPDTSIPQLVVALVYGGDMEADDLTTAPLKVRERETTPEPTVIDSEPKPQPARVKREVRRVEAPKPEAPPVEAQPEDDDYEEDEDVRPAMANAAAAKVGAVARKVGPAIAKVGVGAGAAIGRMIGAMKRRRDEKREERERQRAPKRTTAPPPSGALRSNGKKLFRETQRQSDPPAEVEEAPPPKHDRKRTVFGVVLGLMAVVAIYFASSHFSRAAEGTPAAAASAAAEQPSAAPTGEAVATDEPTAAGVATANVPLFGATPLSTTEPVPVPTNLDGKTPPPGQGAKTEEASGDEGAAKKTGLAPEWGFGEVVNPLQLRIKMNGKLDGISGTENANGFTVTVPGRHSVSSAAGLARKDKRIESVNVVNYPDRAEVSVRFKGEVPPFIAKAKGKVLVLEISNAKDKGKDKDKAEDDKSDEGDDGDDDEKPGKKKR